MIFDTMMHTQQNRVRIPGLQIFRRWIACDIAIEVDAVSVMGQLLNVSHNIAFAVVNPEL